MVNVSVVVPAKNEERFIENCLKALRIQTKKCEIIVVDGHSKDRTREISKKYADKVVLDNRKGISDARNIGTRVARGNIVAYCDADAIPKRNWVENIEKRIRNKICVYGPIVPYDGSNRTRVALKFLNRLVHFFHSLGTPCICGANVAFKRSVLLKHRFDKTLSILEDYEMGNRLKKHGKIGYYNDLEMPISSRRYEDDILYVVFFYYIRNLYRLKTGKKIKQHGYWKQLENIKKV